MANGTFYTYFKRKEDVLFELSEEAFGNILLCFQANISILQQNKRQFNLLPLVNIIFPFFRVTPTIDIEPIFDNKLVL